MIIHKTLQHDILKDLMDEIDTHVKDGWEHNGKTRILEINSSIKDMHGRLNFKKQETWYTADLTFNTSTDKK